MLFDQPLPMIAGEKSDPLAPNARGIERHLRSGLAIDVGSGIDGVGQNLVDSVIAGVDPADLGVRAHLQRKLVALVAQPQPNASRRAYLGTALEDGADGCDDGLIVVKQNLAFSFAPHKAYGKSAPQFTSCSLITNPAIEPGAQHMQLGLAHRSFEAEQQTVVEQRRMIDAVSVPDQCVGQPGEIDEAVPVGVVASEA